MLFYRDVPLMPSAGKDGVIKPLDQSALPLIAWRLKDISRPDSRVLLEEMPTCANCHSFSADGATLAMDLDGPDGDKGAYAIAAIDGQVVIDDEQVISWNAFEGKPQGLNTLGFLSRVSPDGRHVVSTVNEAVYVRNFPNHEFLQVFYPTRGILASYSRETGEIAALPGADDPDYVHCNPVWTPDGESLIFARARARNPYDRDRPVATYAGDPNETPIQYDLYRIPFNGGRGGRPQPIAGASNNGMSNAFPKISPDGKWLVWVQSRNGLLMRPDGKLWIAPLAGGEPRLMRCNTPLMNSWHSFSPNGRWMVFSSKTNRPYTQMFLTHIDEEGNDSPAVLVENATAANRAVNLPEFVNLSYEEFTGIDVPAVDHYEPYKRGTKLAQEGRHAEAVSEFEKALAGETREWRFNDWRIHENMSKVLLGLGDTERAIEHVEKSLTLNPYNAELHANLGYILFERGQLPRAREHLDVALKLAPENAQNWYNRASLRATRGDSAGAIDDYTEAIRRDPDYGEAYNGRGIAHRSEGRLEEAAADFDSAVRLLPDDPTGWYFRALIREETGDPAGAARDAARALEICPPGSPHARQIEALLAKTRTAVEEGG
jgi:tetratricopeptide (TPR) repeat protein